MASILAAAGIPTAVLGLLVWQLKRRIERQEARQEAAEKAREEFETNLYESSLAAIALGEATAKAATLLAILLPLSLELIRMFPILPVLVVFLTLFRIAKHLVRLIDLLKLTMGVGIVRIQVRVILPSQLLIGFLDIILRSVLVHPQNLVIIDI